MTRLRLIVTSVLLAVVLAGGSFVLGMRFDDAPDGFEPVFRTAEEIRSRAAEPVGTEELVRGAVRGMLDVLEDPYAAFLGPGEAGDARALVTGSLSGLGIYIEGGAEGAVVASVLEGSPAAEAGIMPGSVVTSVDGAPTAGRSTREVAAMLQGPEGSSVTLNIRTGSGDREISVRRARLPADDVRSRLVEGGVAYVRVLRFAEGTGERVREDLDDLLGRDARGVVLDLRGNPGGLTDDAVEVAGLFLGEAVVARVREGGEERELTSDGDPVTDLPLAVLVDGGTASAAELVAGALRDHGRAQLVGTQTYGKGTLLAVLDVEGTDAAVQLATGTFVTPGGDEVEGVGLVVDVPVLPEGPVDAQLDRAARLVLGEQA